MAGDRDFGGNDLGATDAQIEAVRLLLTAHVEAVEALLPGCAQATAKSADMKRRAALKMGEHETASALENLLDNLRERFGLPVND